MMYQVEEAAESDGIMIMSSSIPHHSTPTTTTPIHNHDTDDDSSRSTYHHHHHDHPQHQYLNNSKSNNISTSSGGGICSSLFCCITGRGSGNTNSTIVTRCTILCLLCNTIVVIVLFVLVILMGLQLHTLQTQVQQDEEDIATLQTQIATQMNNQQDLNQRVDEEHSLTLYQMAGTFTLLTCLISIFHMTQHLSNYHEPIIQRKIIAILWMSPIYSITSFLSLIFTNTDPYLAVIKDCYEAYTIYTFLSFLIAVLGRGNRTVAIQVLACHAHHLHKPNRCLSFLYDPPPESSPTAMATAVLTECQILAMQFVLVRPISSILTFVLDVVLRTSDTDIDTTTPEDNSYTSYFKSPNFYIAMVTNISVFFAFQGLLKFYHAVHVDLKWCQPFNKFLSIKSIVFLTFWQGLLISILINVNNSSTGSQPNSTPISNSPTATTIGQPAPTLTSIHPMYAPIPSPTIYAPTLVSPQSPDSNDVTVPTTTTAAPPNNNNNNNSTTRHLLSRVLDDPHPTTTGDDEGDNGDGNPSGTDSGNSDANDSASNENYDNNGNGNKSSSSSSDNDNDTHESNKERASQIQNFLICFEMLLFAIGHWCVFPAEEWQPDYRPPMNYAKPGFGISDFAQDISDIVGNATRRRRRRTEYAATDTESAHPHHPNEDDEDGNVLDDDFSNGHGNASVVVEEDDNDNVQPTIHTGEDDVVVHVPLGDVTSTATTTTATPYDHDHDDDHENPLSYQQNVGTMT